MIKNQSRVVILIYMIGFLLGIVYMNMSAGEYISSMGIFNRNFAEQFQKADIKGVQYLGYLVRLRVLPAIILALIGTTRFRSIGSTVFLVWTGILCGVYFTCAVIITELAACCFVWLDCCHIWHVICLHMVFCL